MAYVNVVFVILAIFLVGSIVSFVVIPPLIDKIDRGGKVGIAGF